MAHGRPWYKRNGADLVMATLAMPDAETKWAYSCLIDMLNDRDRPLTDEAGFICGFTGLSKRRWAVVRAYLIAHSYIVETADRCLTNPRFERERAERVQAHQRSVEGGRTGGQKSAAIRAAREPELALGDQPNSDLSPKKLLQESEINGAKVKDKFPLADAEPQKINGLAQPPPQGTRAPEEARGKSRESNPSSSAIETRDLDPIELANHLTRIAGVRNIDPARIITNVAIVREWLDLGVDVVDIERTITAARDQAQGPLHSLKYFDPPIRKAQARKVHPHERTDHQPSEIADPLLRRYLERGGTLDA